MPDGEPAAYLTRRFDVLPTGERLLQEDFAQLTERSRATHGGNFKVRRQPRGNRAARFGSYARAAPPALDEYFRLIALQLPGEQRRRAPQEFCALPAGPDGEYGLTPGYDLLNTSLHVNDGNGLGPGPVGRRSTRRPASRPTPFLAYDDFVEFGRADRACRTSRARRVLAEMAGQEAATDKAAGAARC
ncbi:MAG: hypothetical protein WKG07_14825 [Hymenobacter sp.]